MPLWGWVGIVYGAALAIVAATGRARSRYPAFVASLLYALTVANFARIEDLRVQVLLPGVLILAGYWLSGLFVRAPQPWLERWLLRTDHWLFARLRIDRCLEAAPTGVLNANEFIYSTVYLVVVAGALLVASFGRDAVLYYWAVVFPAELVCCAALPFLRCRPPRTLETPGVIARRGPAMRRFNDLLVSRGSVQVNTIPSAHVASALAAGLAVGVFRPAWGALLIGLAVLIAAAATLGRYHYAVDCALGAAVAVLIYLVV